MRLVPNFQNRTMVTSLLLVALGISSGLAATITYNWDATWVTANPDGFSRPVIGINGQWPCPSIEATAGDQIVVNFTNQLGNQTTSIHFHGIAQNGSSQMDGPTAVSQCPIPPGSTFTYNFTVSLLPPDVTGSC